MSRFTRRFFATCALLAVSIFLGAFAAPECAAQIQGFDRAMAAQVQNNPRLFATPGVVATGIGQDARGRAVVKVYTRQAGVVGIPARLNGVDVVREVSGAITAFPKGGNGGGKPDGGGGGGDDPKSRFTRPVPIGVSIGTYPPNYCFAGTLGCRLKRTDLLGNVSYLILSNNHVLAEENAGGLYPLVTILQPGTLDNNCVLDYDDKIGELSDFVPLKFDGSVNYVDAAVGSTTREDTEVGTPSFGYGVPLSTPIAPTMGGLVQKVGRTTGYTRGYIDAVNVQVPVSYDSGTAVFHDQIIIKGELITKGRRQRNSQFSDGGDSGSLIVADPSKAPVGLLFAGSSTVTVANRIDRVLAAFSVDGSVVQVDDGQ